MSQRVASIESGDQIVVGVNKFIETEKSPLTADKKGFMKINPKLRIKILLFFARIINIFIENK